MAKVSELFSKLDTALKMSADDRAVLRNTTNLSCQKSTDFLRELQQTSTEHFLSKISELENKIADFEKTT